MYEYDESEAIDMLTMEGYMIQALPPHIKENLVDLVQGRFIQKDGSWFELAGKNSYTHHRVCPCCGAEIMKVRGVWESCGREEV